MSNATLLALLASLAWIVSASPISSVIETVICTETTTDNAFANPSWESGTSDWDYNWVPSTTNTYSSDGSYSLVISGNLVTTSYTRQSLSNLQIGSTYNVSVDLKAVVNPVYSSLVEQCFLYIYHDSLTTSNLITTLNKQFRSADSAWATYGGTVTPSSANMVIGIVLSCSPYHTSAIFNAYLDNAIMKAPSQSCSTVSPTPTPTPVPSSTDLSTVSLSTSEAADASPPSSSFSTSSGDSSAQQELPTSSPPTSTSFGLNSTASLSQSSTVITDSTSLINVAISTRPAPTTSASTVNESSSSVSAMLQDSSISTSLMSTLSPANVTRIISTNQTFSQYSLPLNTSSPQVPQSSISGSASIPVTFVHASTLSPAVPTITAGPITASQGLNLSTEASSDTGSMSGVATTDHSSHGVSAVNSASGEQLTTLTVLATSTRTVLSCAPAVTNCPMNPASLTRLRSSSPEQVSTILVTDTIALSTTICPVSAAESISSRIVSAAATSGIPATTFTPSRAPSAGDALTTLTVRATYIRTTVSCAPTVTNCPGRNLTADLTSLPKGMSTVLMTETFDLSTTVCPVTAAESISSSIMSVAASVDFTEKVIVPTSTRGNSSDLVASSSTSADTEATPALSSPIEPTEISWGFRPTVMLSNQDRPSRSSNGTNRSMLSAPVQTAVPTTLKPVVKKPCHRG